MFVASIGRSCSEVAWEDLERLQGNEGKEKVSDGGLRGLATHIETPQGPETRADTNMLCSIAALFRQR